MKPILIFLFLLISIHSFGSEQTAMKLTNWLDECETSKIWNEFTPAIRNIFGGKVKGLEEFCSHLEKEYKAYTIVTSTRKVSDSRTITWWQIRTNPLDKKSVQYRWDLNTRGKVIGLYFGPRKVPFKSKFEFYKTKTDLMLPFQYEWEVVWGGRTVEENYHSAYNDQRYALDILVTKKGKTYKNKGLNLDDYYCYGMDILSPGKGKVISVENQLEDNSIGKMNPKKPLGNHIIIDHANGEFSFLAHLKKGSVVALIDQDVKKGELLGKCGNSGNTSEPHIHYHLQNSSVLYKGDGLPIYFKDIVLKGNNLSTTEIKRGDFVENQ